MMVKKWENLPRELQIAEVRPYYEIMRKKQGSLLAKLIFDVVVSALMLVILSPAFLVLAIAIWGGMYWVSKQFCKKHDIN